MKRRLHGAFLFAMMAIVSLALSGCGSTGGSSTSALDQSSGPRPMAPVTGTSWANIYEGVQFTGFPWARQVVQTSDGGYIGSGSYLFGNLNACLLKLADNGAVTWQKAYFGAYGSRSNAVAQTPDGGYLLAGTVNTDMLGNTDFFVLKANADGTIAWQKQYDDGSPPSFIGQVSSLKATADGGCVVLAGSYGAPEGTSFRKLNADGSIAWQRSYYDPSGSVGLSPCKFQQTADNGFVIVGTAVAPNTNPWVMKVDANGYPVWSNVYSHPTIPDHGRGILQTADGGYVVACYVGRIMKVSSDGSISWVRQYSAAGYEGGERFREIVPAPDGGYTAVGQLHTSVGGVDRWIVKLHTNGVVNWTKLYMDSSAGSSIQSTSDGGYVSGGYQPWPAESLTVLKTQSNGTCFPIGVDMTANSTRLTNVTNTPLIPTVGNAPDNVFDAGLTAGDMYVTVTQLAP